MTLFASIPTDDFFIGRMKQLLEQVDEDEERREQGFGGWLWVGKDPIDVVVCG